MDLMSEGRIKAEVQRGESLRDAWSKKLRLKVLTYFHFFHIVLNKN